MIGNGSIAGTLAAMLAASLKTSPGAAAVCDCGGLNIMPIPNSNTDPIVNSFMATLLFAKLATAQSFQTRDCLPERETAVGSVLAFSEYIIAAETKIVF